MSFLAKSYPLIRPLLFTFGAEASHGMTLRALHLAHACGCVRAPAGQAATHRLMGLPVRNRVGLAAGLDKNGAHIDALGALGFGFIEVGTVTPRPQTGNPRPRLFRLPQAQAIINRMGFNNQGLEAFVANVARSQWRARGGILGLNIGKNADTPIAHAVDDYLPGLDAVYPHADYVTVNISSPNTKNLRALQTQDALPHLLQALADRRARLREQYGRHVPLAVKIAPDLEPAQIDALAATLPRYDIDGVIATNTTLARTAVQGLPCADEAGGLSGAPLHEQALIVVARLRARLGADYPIIGVGGVLHASHARALLAAGAHAVQLYTGLIYRGPALVEECVHALEVG